MRKADDWDVGNYKLRLHRGGPWVPVRVWLEDGDRCPETGELMSDQIWRCQWSPHPRKHQWWPLEIRNVCNYLHETTEEEFEWLILMKGL